MRGSADRAGIASAFHNLANVAYEQGDFTSARVLNSESMVIRQELGHRAGIADLLDDLGNLTFEEGNYPRATTLFKESLAIRRELGDRKAIATADSGLAAVVSALGGHLHAARIWGAVEHLREEVGSLMSPRDRYRRDRRVTAARALLKDDDAFDRAWAEGRALTLEQALEFALENAGLDRAP